MTPTFEREAQAAEPAAPRGIATARTTCRASRRRVGPYCESLPGGLPERVAWAMGPNGQRPQGSGESQHDALMTLAVQLRGLSRSLGPRRRAQNRHMRARRLGILLMALVLAACAVPSRYAFESGSPEDMAARYIAEWGGHAGTYRAIFESWTCDLLANGGGPIPASSEAELNTRHGREQTGYIAARRERMEQVGCVEDLPLMPPE